ncbi:MAG: hypothetical protein SGCHY_004676 [Lobulomycetales sp.]
MNKDMVRDRFFLVDTWDMSRQLQDTSEKLQHLKDQALSHRQSMHALTATTLAKRGRVAQMHDAIGLLDRAVDELVRDRPDLQTALAIPTHVQHAFDPISCMPPLSDPSIPTAVTVHAPGNVGVAAEIAALRDSVEVVERRVALARPRLAQAMGLVAAVCDGAGGGDEEEVDVDR